MAPKLIKSIRTTRVKGQSLIELAAGLVVLIPVVMALVDLAFIIAAMQINDAACRDAARAAAAGPPEQKFQRANQVVDQVYKGSQVKGYLDGPKVKDGDVTTNPGTLTDPGPFGGPYQGTIKVKTSMKLTMPVQVPIVPQTMTPIEFWSQQEFPITYVKPNTATIP